MRGVRERERRPSKNSPMSTVIPIKDVRAATPAAVRDAFLREAANAPAVAVAPADARGRPLHDLRISVTDRCNFRCVYCMPKDVYGRDFPFLRHADLLTFEEVTRMARIFVAHGVRKLRLTGGEPLLRRNLERLVEMLAALGEVDVTLTTNGALLARKARALREAGLSRIGSIASGPEDQVSGSRGADDHLDGVR